MWDCGGRNGALKGEIPVRLMDECGRPFGVKQSISSICLNISLSQIQQCQEILGSFENDQGTPTSSLPILTAPALDGDAVSG